MRMSDPQTMVVELLDGGWTQKALAKKLGESQSSISRLYRGETLHPDYRLLRRLIALYNKTRFQNIISALQSQDWTQTKIADRLSLSRVTVCNIANGKSPNPSYRTAIGLIALQEGKDTADPVPSLYFQHLIRELCDSGMSQLQIATEIGMSQTGVASVLHDPDREPRWASANALIQLHARTVR